MNKIKGKILKKILSPEEYARKMGVTVGEGCKFYGNIHWGSEPYLITIGNNVRITNGVSFITHDGGVWVVRNLGLNKKSKYIDVFGKVVIGNNVHIGWNAIIMPGVTIGDNVIIGAGAIVTKDIESNSVAVGVPAKVIETIDEYNKKVLEKCDNTKGLSAKEKKEYLLKKYRNR